MKKQDLLKIIDDSLLESLFGFCYARTNDSHEAEELCSDIVFALVKAAKTEGEVEKAYPFIWRIARNVYADYSEKRRKRSEVFYEGDPESVLLTVTEEEADDNDDALLSAVYRRIAFLTKAYREVMIMFYIDGLTTSEIASIQGTSEGAVRQRLFSARQKIKNEVEEMTENHTKPVSLDDINFVIWGTGNPSWGDPREGFCRKFSNHVIWLCRKKPMSASEIAEQLNVPTVYVEEELEILRRGENGEYGFLRRTDNGKYIINFVLLEKEILEKAHAIYNEQLPMLCDKISEYIDLHKDEYLGFPYLNKRVDMNLILWQQVSTIADAFHRSVNRVLKKKYFADVTEAERPFTVFGYEDNGMLYGGGWDGIAADNVCGYKQVRLDNIYVTRIRKHFSCGHNVSLDPQLQLAIRAIDGIDVRSLSETEKEQAAKAIECGYLFREDDTLYTKILACKQEDRENLFRISHGLDNEGFEEYAEAVAEKLAQLIRESIPAHLLGEWRFANSLANMPILDSVIECLIEKRLLTPPENGVGAEGCWMSVEE